ncbi:MAG: aspartate/glutamate racemase family protein [Dehalococcoidales bacterium]
MGRKVGMVHAGCFNVRLFNELIAEVMPDVEVVHLVDEGLPFMADEQLHGRVVRRLKVLSSFAEESGAEVVLLTCTAFGRLADEVGEAVKVPVLSVLEIIIDEAMGISDHIGIFGTHPGTLASGAQIIQEQSTDRGEKIEVKTQLCPGAFDALRRGDMATHDRIVLEHLDQLMNEVAVIIVPQPSMERVMKQVLETSRRVPILSSAHLSVRRLKEKLDSLA